MADFKMDDYNDVAARIRDFKEKHPEGSLQPADIFEPYRVATIGDKTFIVYTALAYRTPDDDRPGVGVAWEPFPGRSNFTRDSELQNAETSAWGRAIVASLAADTKKGVAAAEDIRNRQADEPVAVRDPLQPARDQLFGDIRALSAEGREQVRAFCDEHSIPRAPGRMDADQLAAVSAKVDAVYIAATSDAPAEALAEPSEAPQGPPMGDDTVTAPAETPGPPAEAEKPNGSADAVQAAIDTVAGMPSTAILGALRERNLDTSGNTAARAQRLAAALVDEHAPTA